jgi:hypothetical protein
MTPTEMLEQLGLIQKSLNQSTAEFRNFASTTCEGLTGLTHADLLTDTTAVYELMRHADERIREAASLFASLHWTTGRDAESFFVELAVNRDEAWLVRRHAFAGIARIRARNLSIESTLRLVQMIRDKAEYSKCRAYGYCCLLFPSHMDFDTYRSINESDNFDAFLDDKLLETVCQRCRQRG